MACCDCGLVHNVDFRIYKGRVQLKATRNNRATEQKRRHMKNKTSVTLNVSPIPTCQEALPKYNRANIIQKHLFKTHK